MAVMNSKTKLEGFCFLRTTLKGAKLAVAPMVDQSELAWRIMSRRHGAHLCYTPMFHASLFRNNATYRKENFQTCPEDRPLIVQFCANDPVTLLEAARLVETQCDAVDINLGCPQLIAKRGHYGAFLQDEWQLVSEMVNLLHRELAVPVTCKIRVFNNVHRTVEYAQMLEKSGCQLLTVHGRTRDQKGAMTGLASWKHIKAVKESVNIPVFANGNIQCLKDVELCLAETGVDGVMSAEGNLYNPSLFTGDQPPCWTMVEEYLELVKVYPTHLSYIRGHLFKLWHHVLQTAGYHHFRDKLGIVKKLEKMEEVSKEIKSTLLSNLTKEEIEADYIMDNLPFWRCHSYVRPPPHSVGETPVKRGHDTEDENDSVAIKRRKRKEARSRKIPQQHSKVVWATCSSCKTHPKSNRCINDCCRNCCKKMCYTDILDCPGHCFLFKSKLNATSATSMASHHSDPAVSKLQNNGERFEPETKELLTVDQIKLSN